MTIKTATDPAFITHPALGESMSLVPASLPSPAASSDDAAHAVSQLRLDLPAEISAVPVARHVLTTVLGWWGITGEGADHAELVLGELAANAAQHGGALFTVEAKLDAGSRNLTLTVIDFGSRAGRPDRQCAADECGRGLVIVEQLTTWIRLDHGDGQRRVTVAIDLSPFHVAAAGADR
jgi:anti-sigma regulatory factor (Ser/Thr protein kinase)